MSNNDFLVRRGFAEAEKITEHFAKTFYFASCLLPSEKRSAAFAVYAICRTSDEAVDTPHNAQDRRNLDEIRRQIQTAYSDAPMLQPLLTSFRKTINTYAIPQEYFTELLAGMEMDLGKNRYATFDELYDYCYKVAGVVGLIMLRIFGFRKQEALTHAVELGIAMQLTNILRDITEDLGRGRIYIPCDEMQQYRVDETTLRHKKLVPDLKNLLIYQVQRARAYYRKAEQGIPLITDKNCRLTVRAMANLYEGILDDIARHGYNVFERRAHVAFPEKVVRIGKILMQGAFS